MQASHSNVDNKKEKTWRNLFVNNLACENKELVYVPPELCDGIAIVKLKAQEVEAMEKVWEHVVIHCSPVLTYKCIKNNCMTKLFS